MKRMVDEKEVVKDIEAVEGGIKVLQLDGTSKTVPVSGSGGSVDWDDIQNKPTFATVATSGDYDDLTDKPSIPAAQVQSDYAQSDNTQVDYIKNKPDLSIYAETSDLATVATTGDYDDLTNKPDLSIYAESSDLATVATTGDYDDLINKPTIPTVDYPVTDVTVGGTSVVSNKVAVIPALFSGDYDDLTNKPTIPAAQVNSDWNAASGVAQILNKPSLATVATTGAYSDLSGTPTIPDAVSGVNDGTNWTSITIGSVTKAIPQGGGGGGSITIDTTTGSESISDGTNTLNVVTRDTAQTITANKTFEGYVTLYGNKFGIRQGSGTSSSDRPTVSLKNSNGFEVGFLQYHITNNQIVYGADERYSSGIQIALRQYNTSNAYSAILPTTSNKASNIGSGDITLPLGIKIGLNGTVIKANTGGLIELPDYPNISTKLDATACTYQTTAPTAAIADGGVHIVYLTAEPATKYSGYIYMIAEN